MNLTFIKLVDKLLRVEKKAEATASRLEDKKVFGLEMKKLIL